MEALNVDWLVEHAHYLRFGLLSALLIFPRGPFVRMVIALFAGLELAFALGRDADRTTIIWMSILLGLALLISVSSLFGRRRTRLSAEEQAMTTHLLKGVGRSRARHFIDQGYWLNGRPGEVLLREGEPVTQFCYLSEGEARVQMGGRAIGFCRGGDLVGGLGFFSGETSAATVVLATPARFWCAPADRLNAYFGAHGDLKRKIRRSMGDALPADLEEDATVSGERALPASA